MRLAAIQVHNETETGYIFDVLSLEEKSQTSMPAPSLRTIERLKKITPSPEKGPRTSCGTFHSLSVFSQNIVK